MDLSQVVDSDQGEEDAEKGGREGHVSGQHGHRLLPEMSVAHHSDQRHAEVGHQKHTHHRLHPVVRHDVQSTLLTRVFRAG